MMTASLLQSRPWLRGLVQLPPPQLQQLKRFRLMQQQGTPLLLQWSSRLADPRAPLQT